MAYEPKIQYSCALTHPTGGRNLVQTSSLPRSFMTLVVMITTVSVFPTDDE